MHNVIHVTHEAVYKVGGIGTVLEGLINSRPYREAVGRTVLVCPLFYPENTVRLGPGGELEYSSRDQVFGGPYVDSFRQIEREFGVHLVYGRRPLEDEPSGRRTACEVLLVDLRGINRERVNELKGLLWEHCGLQSQRFEHIWEFEQYVQVAAPAAAVLEAMQLGNADQPTIVLAHEFMGVPTAHALTFGQPNSYRSLFYAHEVAAVRRIVEQHPGHDVMFYNMLELARRQRLYMDDVFGSQFEYFKHAVVDAARYCDGILAVGHHVVHELEFLGPRFAEADINIAYNGVPVVQITPAERGASRAQLRRYCQTLLGWAPDLIFTHVTRLAMSKALWRDLDVLEALDAELTRRRQSAVLLVLSTEMPRRPVEDIRHMEAAWNWPLAHREGPPDLTAGEARYYRRVQAFNARSRNCAVVYINQFGFSRETCGSRVPAEIEFMDLRRGTDVEFGLSLYEPFGISPLEPLTFGGLCVVSSSCGCAGMLAEAGGRDGAPSVIVADVIHAGQQPTSIKQAMQIEHSQRRQAELASARHVAAQILQRLPADAEEEARLMQAGYELAQRMSWDVVAQRYIFPAMRQASARRRTLKMA
ncbi:MAG: hypothetical protein KKB50_01730 [Planctomycetes bacterium]|nr:hypothetical protein [Planctomycetota bacterium]